jgi:hypothetical protein
LLAAAVGLADLAHDLSEAALATYRRLGAARWARELSDATVPDAAHRPGTGGVLQRTGPTWHVEFAGRRATVPHVKGLSDIARLVAADGAEVHALDLVESADRSGPAGNVVDRAALDAYRARLRDLDEDLDEATAAHDTERSARIELERQALIDELSRATGVGRRSRQFANHPAERARKAVSARIRDAIRRLEPLHPELAAHLERAVVTGTYCRYRPDGAAWHVEAG